MFRKEVLKQQENRLQGRVILQHSKWETLCVVLLMLGFVLSIFFLMSASYSKKVLAPGYIVSSKAMLRHSVSARSLIDQLFIKEGDYVSKGQKLARLQADMLHDPQGLSQAFLDTQFLEEQLAQTRKSTRLLKQGYKQKRLETMANMESIKKEIGQLKKQQMIAQQKLSINEDLLERAQGLFDKGFLKRFDLQRQRQQTLDDQSGLAHIDQQLLIKQREYATLKQYLQNSVVDIERELLEQHKLISQLTAQTKTVETSAQHYLVAKQAGWVRNLLFREGELVKPGVSIVDLQAKGSHWQALLLLPAGSSGLLDVGMPVSIRLQAFPYQRFGLVQGRIQKIEQTLIHPHEARFELAPQGAVYRVWVTINKQFMSSLGVQYALRQGMLLHADVIQERRTLMAWLLGSLQTAWARL